MFTEYQCLGCVIYVSPVCMRESTNIPVANMGDLFTKLFKGRTAWDRAIAIVGITHPLTYGGGNAPMADKLDMPVLQQLVSTTRNASIKPPVITKPACCAILFATSTLTPATYRTLRINVCP